MKGTIAVDKPEGMTSHDVVSRVRRIAGTRRIGHAGTLDPFATGVLVICVGRATRLVQFLVGLEKEYVATVRLGFATDTQDLTGKQIAPVLTSNELSLERLRSTLDEFKGRQLQLPPMFSAKKVGGERLYKAARAGRDVERKPVEVTLHVVELIESGGETLKVNADGTTDFIMRVRCSSGTYIRTLAHDIGERIGVGAHLAALRRTAVGQFRIEEAATLEELEDAAREGRFEDALTCMNDSLAHLSLVRLDSKRVELVANGREVLLAQAETGSKESTVRMVDEGGELVAVGILDGLRKVVKPMVVFIASANDAATLHKRA